MSRSLSGIRPGVREKPEAVYATEASPGFFLPCFTALRFRMTQLFAGDDAALRERRRLPGVQVAVALDDLDLCAEEIGHDLGCDEVMLGGVGVDAAGAEHEHAIHLGEDVAEVVGDHQDANAHAGDGAEDFTQLLLCGHVEGVGRLVEEKHFWRMDECAGDKDAALLAGGHAADKLFCKVMRVQEAESGVGPFAHFGGDSLVGPEGGGAQQAGDDDVAAARGGRSFGRKRLLDDAEILAQLGDDPAVIAEEAHAGAILWDGVALARDGLDERGFAAAVGPEDDHLLATCDAQRNVMENDVFAAGDIDVLHFKKKRGLGRSHL